MTLQEAIRSGKPFKRKDWSIYYQPGAQVFLDAELILATDWEVKEEETTTITKKQALHALQNYPGYVLLSFASSEEVQKEHKDTQNKYLRDLGFKE